jgi:hypothetical protein
MKKKDTRNVAGATPSINVSSGSNSNFPLPGDSEQSITLPVQGGYKDLDIAIGIKCTNIPVGSMVAFACSGTPALSATVDTGWMAVTMPGYAVMMQVVMPRGFSGMLTIRYRPAPAGQLPRGAHIEPALKLLE